MSNPATSSAPSPTRPDLDSKFIGRINIFDDYSLVDLPENMPKELLAKLRQARVIGQRLNISLLGGKKSGSERKASDTNKRSKPKVQASKTKGQGQTKTRTPAEITQAACRLLASCVNLESVSPARIRHRARAPGNAFKRHDPAGLHDYR